MDRVGYQYAAGGEVARGRRGPKLYPAAALVWLAVLASAACTAVPDRSGSKPAESFADPFAYCAAVGTIDAPDARYAGPPIPDSVVHKLMVAVGAPADAPAEMFARGTSWRCMEGQVYACTIGANLPCAEKADASRTPAPPLVAFCRESPEADVIPAYVTGRATVYDWRCRAGTPQIVRTLTEPDAQGFRKDVWYGLE